MRPTKTQHPGSAAPGAHRASSPRTLRPRANPPTHLLARRVGHRAVPPPLHRHPQVVQPPPCARGGARVGARPRREQGRQHVAVHGRRPRVERRQHVAVAAEHAHVVGHGVAEQPRAHLLQAQRRREEGPGRAGAGALGGRRRRRRGRGRRGRAADGPRRGAPLRALGDVIDEERAALVEDRLPALRHRPLRVPRRPLLGGSAPRRRRRRRRRVAAGGGGARAQRRALQKRRRGRGGDVQGNAQQAESFLQGGGHGEAGGRVGTVQRVGAVEAQHAALAARPPHAPPPAPGRQVLVPGGGAVDRRLLPLLLLLRRRPPLWLLPRRRRRRRGGLHAARGQPHLAQGLLDEAPEGLHAAVLAELGHVVVPVEVEQLHGAGAQAAAHRAHALQRRPEAHGEG